MTEADLGLAPQTRSRVRFVIVRSSHLLNSHLGEAQALKKALHRTACVSICLCQNSILQCRLLELSLALLPYFGFKVRVSRREKARVTRIDASLAVVETRAEEFCGWQPKRNAVVMHGNVAGLNAREIDTRNDLSMHEEQQAITYQKLWHVATVGTATDNLVHRVAHSLKALKLSDLADYRRLIDIEVNATALKDL